MFDDAGGYHSICHEHPMNIPWTSHEYSMNIPCIFLYQSYPIKCHPIPFLQPIISQKKSRQGGTVGTTTPLPNGLIEEIIDDEMAKMNWEPGMKETLMLGAWSTSFWRLQIIHFKRYTLWWTNIAMENHHFFMGKSTINGHFQLLC